MSHHCGVLGVCVGVHNYKPFVLLVFYGFFAAAILAVGCLPEALRRGRQVLFGEGDGHVRVSVGMLVWFQMYYLQYCMTVGLGGLLAFHLYLIAMGRTVLEACRLNPFRQVFPPWKAVKYPFDRGVRQNFVDVFGTGWTVLLPVVDDSWVKHLESNDVTEA